MVVGAGLGEKVGVELIGSGLGIVGGKKWW